MDQDNDVKSLLDDTITQMGRVQLDLEHAVRTLRTLTECPCALPKAIGAGILWCASCGSLTKIEDLGDRRYRRTIERPSVHRSAARELRLRAAMHAAREMREGPVR